MSTYEEEYEEREEPISRPTDPDTSHLAEEEHTKSGRRSVRRQQVLSLVKAHPGCTSGEISRYFLKEYPQLSIRTAAETPHKRLPELEKRGLVKRGDARKCKDSGQLAATWWSL